MYPTPSLLYHCFLLLIKSNAMNLKIRPIPAFNDNYIWLLQHGQNPSVCIVDPGDAAPVLAVLKDEGLTIGCILITHHHADHIGGVKDLLAAFPEAEVYGPHSTKIDCISHRVKQDDHFQVLGLELTVIEVPGHTLDHIAYYVDGDANDAPMLFCGDTLFAGGCGRIFEGTPPMMLASLKKLSSLHSDTRVYCAHEYTLANLRFALAAEPSNEDLPGRIATTMKLREAGTPSLPSTINWENRTNPFLRCHKDAVAQTVSAHTRVEVQDVTTTFAQLRAWKDNF